MQSIPAQPSMQNTSGKIVWVRDEDVYEFLYGGPLQEVTSLERQLLLGEIEHGRLMGSQRGRDVVSDSAYSVDSIAVDWPDTKGETQCRHSTALSSSPELLPSAWTLASPPHVPNTEPALSDVQIFRPEYGQCFTDHMFFVPPVDEYDSCWLPGGVDIAAAFELSTIDSPRTPWSTLTRTDGLAKTILGLDLFERSTELSIRDAHGFEDFGLDATCHFIYIPSPKRACLESDIDIFTASFLPCLVGHPSEQLIQNQLAVELFSSAAFFDFGSSTEAPAHTSAFMATDTSRCRTTQRGTQTGNKRTSADQKPGASNADYRYNPVCKQRLQIHKDYNGKGTFDPRAVDPVTLDPLPITIGHDCHPEGPRPLKRKERPNEDEPEASPSNSQQPPDGAKKSRRGRKPKAFNCSPSPGAEGWTCHWGGCSKICEATSEAVKVHVAEHGRGLPDEPMTCLWSGCMEQLKPRSLRRHFVRKHNEGLSLSTDEFACAGACGDEDCDKAWGENWLLKRHLRFAFEKGQRKADRDQSDMIPKVEEDEDGRIRIVLVPRSSED